MCPNLGKAFLEELEELYKATWALLHARWRDLGKEKSRALVGIRIQIIEALAFGDIVYELCIRNNQVENDRRW